MLLTLLCSTVAALHPPVKDFQGEWHVYKMEVQEAGKGNWRTLTFSWPTGPYWRVRGAHIESTYCEHKVFKLLSADPKGTFSHDPKEYPVGGPTGVRFTDWDGVVYTGTYALNKDGTAVLKVQGSAPVAGVGNTEGPKYLIIHLERPKPPRDPFAPRPTP